MRNEYIPKALKEYRKKNHFTVKDVAMLPHNRSIEVAPKTIYGWESGQANPSADMLLTLCELYNITDILSTFGYVEHEQIHLSASEITLIKAYRKHPEMHAAVHKLLDLSVTKRKVRRTE